MTGKFKINILNQSKTLNKYIKSLYSRVFILEFYIYWSLNFLSSGVGGTIVGVFVPDDDSQVMFPRPHSQEEAELGL